MHVLHVRRSVRTHDRRRSWGRKPDLGAAGFSLVELVVAMAISMIAITLVLVAMTGAVNTTYNGVAAGQANDRASLALDVLGRQVVAADVVYKPNPTATGVPSATSASYPTGSTVRMLTTWRGTTTCVQWRVRPTGQLQDRSWPNGQPTLAGNWVAVVTSVVNTEASTPPFVLDTTHALGSRVLEVHLVLRATSTSTSSSNKTQARTSFTALDAEFYAATAKQFCTPPTW